MISSLGAHCLFKILAYTECNYKNCNSSYAIPFESTDWINLRIDESCLNEEYIRSTISTDNINLSFDTASLVLNTELIVEITQLLLEIATNLYSLSERFVALPILALTSVLCQIYAKHKPVLLAIQANVCILSASIIKYCDTRVNDFKFVNTDPIIYPFENSSDILHLSHSVSVLVHAIHDNYKQSRFNTTLIIASIELCNNLFRHNYLSLVSFLATELKLSFSNEKVKEYLSSNTIEYIHHLYSIMDNKNSIHSFLRNSISILQPLDIHIWLYYHSYNIYQILIKYNKEEVEETHLLVKNTLSYYVNKARNSNTYFSYLTADYINECYMQWSIILCIYSLIVLQCSNSTDFSKWLISFVKSELNCAHFRNIQSTMKIYHILLSIWIQESELNWNKELNDKELTRLSIFEDEICHLNEIYNFKIDQMYQTDIPSSLSQSGLKGTLVFEILTLAIENMIKKVLLDYKNKLKKISDFKSRRHHLFLKDAPTELNDKVHKFMVSNKIESFIQQYTSSNPSFTLNPTPDILLTTNDNREVNTINTKNRLLKSNSYNFTTDVTFNKLLTEKLQHEAESSDSESCIVENMTAETQNNPFGEKMDYEDILFLLNNIKSNLSNNEHMVSYNQQGKVSYLTGITLYFIFMTLILEEEKVTNAIQNMQQYKTTPYESDFLISIWNQSALLIEPEIEVKKVKVTKTGKKVRSEVNDTNVSKTPLFSPSNNKYNYLTLSSKYLQEAIEHSIKCNNIEIAVNSMVIYLNVCLSLNESDKALDTMYKVQYIKMYHYIAYLYKIIEKHKVLGSNSADVNVPLSDKESTLSMLGSLNTYNILNSANVNIPQSMQMYVFYKDKFTENSGHKHLIPVDVCIITLNYNHAKFTNASSALEIDASNYLYMSIETSIGTMLRRYVISKDVMIDFISLFELLYSDVFNITDEFLQYTKTRNIDAHKLSTDNEYYQEIYNRAIADLTVLLEPLAVDIKHLLGKVTQIYKEINGMICNKAILLLDPFIIALPFELCFKTALSSLLCTRELNLTSLVPKLLQREVSKKENTQKNLKLVDHKITIISGVTNNESLRNELTILVNKINGISTNIKSKTETSGVNKIDLLDSSCIDLGYKTLSSFSKIRKQIEKNDVKSIISINFEFVPELLLSKLSSITTWVGIDIYSKSNEENSFKRQFMSVKQRDFEIIKRPYNAALLLLSNGIQRVALTDYSIRYESIKNNLIQMQILELLHRMISSENTSIINIFELIQLLSNSNEVQPNNMTLSTLDKKLSREITISHSTSTELKSSTINKLNKYSFTMYGW